MGGGRKRRDRGVGRRRRRVLLGRLTRFGCRAWGVGGGVREGARQQQTGGATDPS